MSHTNRLISPAQPTRSPGVRPQPGHKLRKAKLALILASCFVLSLAVVAQYSSLVILNYRLSSVRTELAQLKEASRVLELEVAQLSSVSRIEEIARGELGMVDPQVSQMIVLTAGLGEVNRLGE
ncbi:MAG: cell division protein FtsL [Bacillota bacterium]